MCRLLAFVADRPLSVQEAIGAADLASFADLSPRHPDGWGVAWTGPDGPERRRGLGEARLAEAFADATREVHATAALLHLRGATPGLTIEFENAHPFLRGGAAFAQNGALYPQERLPELLPPELEAQVRGSTDSERLFLLLHERYAGGGEPFPAVARACLAEVLATYSSPVLNCMYLEEDALHVVNAHDPTSIPYPGDPHDIFALRYRVEDGLVVVASTGFDQPESRGWRTLDNMTVLTVDRATLALSIERLDGVPALSHSYGPEGAAVAPPVGG